MRPVTDSLLPSGVKRAGAHGFSSRPCKASRLHLRMFRTACWTHHGCFSSAVAVGRVSGFLTSVDLTKSDHWVVRLGGNLMASLYMISAAV